MDFEDDLGLEETESNLPPEELDAVLARALTEDESRKATE